MDEYFNKKGDTFMVVCKEEDETLSSSVLEAVAYLISRKLINIVSYLIDLVVNNLFKCFTYTPTQHTISFKTPPLSFN